MTERILIELLLPLQAILLLFALAILARMFGRAKRAKERQDRLIRSLGDDASDAWFRINLARPAHFAKRLKLLGFEAKGLLVNRADHVRILAELESGERIDRVHRKSELGLRWVGNAGMASANMHWLGIGAGEGALYLSADTGFNALQSREATADICRIIDPRLRLPGIATAEFALEKNPASLAVVVAFFLLLAFAFADGVVLNRNELLGFGWLPWAAPAFAGLAVPAYRWLVRRRVPARESTTLAMLLCLALFAAYIPAMKRADQFLSESGATAVAYRLGPDAVLAPVDPGPPTIDYGRRKEYWAQFEVGSIHHFDLIHGPLGLWQLDHTALAEKFREFYEASAKAKSVGQR